MNCVITDAWVYGGGFFKKDILIRDGLIIPFSSRRPPNSGAVSFQFHNCHIFPGFADVHVHLREPGFCYKETIATGARAAARGGYFAVCAMPNLDPVPDSLEHLYEIPSDAAARVLRYGSITRGERGTELSDMDALAPYVVAFSDDGRGVQSDALMRAAMLKARSLGKIIAAHCEDERYTGGEAEWLQLQRDLRLTRETGCAYHMCHCSTKESVALIRSAKAAGLDVTCETAPHYLLLDKTLARDDGRFKMNPPLGTPEDRAALIEAVRDGTVDMIATDHAPHAENEKSKGFAGSLNGIVGLETAFPALYTGLVKTGVISLGRLVELMSVNPVRRFGLDVSGSLTVFDLNNKYTLDPGSFLSKGRSTPFAGMEVFGKCLLTTSGGRITWREQ